MEKNHGLTTVHTNVTTRIQCGTKNGKINFQRVTPFSEEYQYNSVNKRNKNKIKEKREFNKKNDFFISYSQQKLTFQ